MNKYKIFESEDCILYMENEIPGMLEGVFLHWEIFSWSHSKVKKYRKLFAHVINKLNTEGIQNMYAIAPSSFEEKLIKMFGFEDTGLLFNGYKLMRLT